MKTKLYVIRDIQANRDLNIMQREKDEVAIRDFTRMCSAVPSQDNPFAATPEDYTLYRVGEYDDEIGTGNFEERFRLINGKEACMTDERDEAIRAFEAKLMAALDENDKKFIEIRHTIEAMNRALDSYDKQYINDNIGMTQ